MPGSFPLRNFSQRSISGASFKVDVCSFTFHFNKLRYSVFSSAERGAADGHETAVEQNEAQYPGLFNKDVSSIAYITVSEELCARMVINVGNNGPESVRTN